MDSGLRGQVFIHCAHLSTVTDWPQPPHTERFGLRSHSSLCNAVEKESDHAALDRATLALAHSLLWHRGKMTSPLC
jgi:hypothetical protein